MTADIGTQLPGFIPDWVLPEGVGALQTQSGTGCPPFGGFNLGDHVGDHPDRVEQRRQQLAAAIHARPVWLRQVHGTAVQVIDRMTFPSSPTTAPPTPAPECDAALTREPGMACAIMTADCLPVLVADRQARVVGAAHAGWRGLAAGVIEQLIAAMTETPGVSPGDLTVWLGPSIGPTAFEVGPEVVEAFTAQAASNRRHFKPHPQPHSDAAGQYLADLPALAGDVLLRLGVTQVTTSGLCTVGQPDRFYSYRRHPVTGRMASLIWLT